MDQILPETIKTQIPVMAKAELRGLVARTIIDVLRSLSMATFGTPNLGERVEETLVVIAVLLGQAEDRLMCASDIASYIGLPRATVIRKLRTVHMVRMLGKERQGSRACYYIKDPNNQSGMQEIRKAMAVLRQCCEGLSKMDTRKLDGNL